MNIGCAGRVGAAAIDHVVLRDRLPVGNLCVEEADLWQAHAAEWWVSQAGMREGGTDCLAGWSLLICILVAIMMDAPQR